MNHVYNHFLTSWDKERDILLINNDVTRPCTEVELQINGFLNWADMSVSRYEVIYILIWTIFMKVSRRFFNHTKNSQHFVCWQCLSLSYHFSSLNLLYDIQWISLQKYSADTCADTYADTCAFGLYQSKLAHYLKAYIKFCISVNSVKERE